MADSNEKRYKSWEEYYLKKGKEDTGLIKILNDAELSTFDKLPCKYADDPAVFKENIAQYPFGNCILIPSGGNYVRCMHSCFVFGDLGKPTEVIGILGSMRSSPFKSLNIEHAVKAFQEPNATRATQSTESSGGELWLPTMDEFSKCKNPEEFKNLTAGGEGFPASELWERAQTFWIHPRVFQIMEPSYPQKAGVLAMHVMCAFGIGVELNDDEVHKNPEEIHQLMIFLWAVENQRATKVSISDAPFSELFDNRVQGIMDKLDPVREQIEEKVRRWSPPPSPDSARNERSPMRKKDKKRRKSRKEKMQQRLGHSSSFERCGSWRRRTPRQGKQLRHQRQQPTQEKESHQEIQTCGKGRFRVFQVEVQQEVPDQGGEGQEVSLSIHA